MKPFREILFPTDFSAAAERMAPYAREMAERFHAHVTVVHAFELAPSYATAPHLPGEWMETGPIPYVPAFQERRLELQEQLEEFASGQFGSVPRTATIEDGEPAKVIEWAAQRCGADLIVMPTMGHGKFRSLLLGSVTAKALHDIACPILTSAHQPEPASAAIGGFHSVLCAVEMNREAAEILDAAGFLARAYGARLCLVHMESASSNANGMLDAAQSVKQPLQEALADYERAGVKASVRVLDASVPEGIRRTAIEEAADLVVVGRGRVKGALTRLWSPLYTIIRESPCPVLSV